MITQEKGARLEFKCDRLLSASSHSELAIRCGVGAFSVAFCALFRFTFNVRDNRFSSFSLSLSLSFFTHWQGCIPISRWQQLPLPALPTTAVFLALKLNFITISINVTF